MNEQSRINAMISYFFLGPLFLLAKKGTPLSEAYVRGHAMRASIIMLIAFFTYLGYAFLLRGWIDFSILTFHIQDIILTLLSVAMLASLGQGAHRAYHGITAESVEMHVDTSMFHHEQAGISIDNEEQKIRIIASMIPFVGIYLARRYSTPEIIRGRIIGSTFALMMIAASIVSSDGAFLLSLTVILSVLIYTVLSVNIYMKGVYTPGSLLSHLPSYSELEAHIFAGGASVVEFFRIAFGGEGRRDYHTLYMAELARAPLSHAPTTLYFMPAILIGLPVWNIFTLPSLWIEKYREYREYIISGLIITLSMGLIVVFSSSASPYLLLFLFPIIHMMTYASTDLAAYVPGIHIIMRIIGMARATREKIGIENNKENTVSFQYETPEVK